MAKSLDQVVAKWGASTAGGTQSYEDGIRNTTVDPTQLAIQNQAGYLAGVQAGLPRWVSGLRAAGKQKWQDKSIAKSANWANGVSAGKDDFAKSMATWLPIIQQTGSAAKAMPGTTIDQRIARSAYVAKTLYNRKRGL